MIRIIFYAQPIVIGAGGYMQRLEGLMRKALQQYNMISAGDHICMVFPVARIALPSP